MLIDNKQVEEKRYGYDSPQYFVGGLCRPQK